MQKVIERKVKKEKGAVTSMTWLDPPTIAVGLENGDIVLMDGNTGTKMRSWKAYLCAGDFNHPGRVVTFLVAVTTQQLVSECNNHVKSWDIESGTLMWSNDFGFHNDITTLALVMEHIAVGVKDGIIFLLEVISGQQSFVFSHQGRIVGICSVSKDMFVSGSRDDTICVWSSTSRHVTKTGKRLFSLSPARHGVVAGLHDLISNWRVAFYQLDPKTGMFTETWLMRSGSYQGIPFHHMMDPFLVTVLDIPNNRQIRITSILDKHHFRFIVMHGGPISSILFSSCGTRMITGSHDRCIRIQRLYYDLEVRLASMMHGLICPAFKTLFAKCKRFYLA